MIEIEKKSFPVDSLLAAGYIVYLSDADENIRDKAIKEWKSMMKNTKFEFLKFMTTESAIL